MKCLALKMSAKPLPREDAGQNQENSVDHPGRGRNVGLGTDPSVASRMPHDPLRLRTPAETDQYKTANYYSQSEAKDCTV